MIKMAAKEAASSTENATDAAKSATRQSIVGRTPIMQVRDQHGTRRTMMKGARLE